jgi:hypothetical protein
MLTACCGTCTCSLPSNRPCTSDHSTCASTARMGPRNEQMDVCASEQRVSARVSHESVSERHAGLTYVLVRVLVVCIRKQAGESNKDFEHSKAQENAVVP